MTGTPGGNQSRYELIFNCLDAVSHFSSTAHQTIPALQELRELLSAIPTPAAAAGANDGPPATPSDALALATIASSGLSLGGEPSVSTNLETETAGRLGNILASLVDQLGAVTRWERAGLVRGLYVIIDPEVTGGREPLEIARAAVRGGARMLQLRDKLTDKGESLPLAMALQRLCEENSASLIINDHADVAAAVGSAGLHVGQTDLPVMVARKVLGHQQVLGRSNHEIEELIESEEMGADHVAFGPIYHTGTKDVGHDPQGNERLLLARETANTPLVAIGGINAENAAGVIEAGADAICVAASVGLAPEPEAVAARLVKVIEEAGGRT